MDIYVYIYRERYIYICVCVGVTIYIYIYIYIIHILNIFRVKTATILAPRSLPSSEALCQGQISAWSLVPISLDRSTFFSSQETNPKSSDGYFPEETLNINQIFEYSDI